MTASVRLDPSDETIIDPLHIARSHSERTRGLLGRTSLPEREGMWFPECRFIHTFGMQFPIDLLYLNTHHEICKIVHALPPSRLSACLTADSVIELQSGAAKRMGLRRGIVLNIVE